jgi:hypothetical protein
MGVKGVLTFLEAYRESKDMWMKNIFSPDIMLRMKATFPFAYFQIFLKIM